MTSIQFIILGLATWRISALFSKEAGPFRVFEKIRKMAGIVHDVDGNIVMIPHKFFAELLSCVWCASVWAGMFWGISFYIAPTVTVMVASLFALSTVAIIVERFS